MVIEKKYHSLRRTIRPLYLLFAFFFLLAQADAATYWTAATGGINAVLCSFASGDTDPGRYIRTIKGGAACLKAGDTLKIKNGIYAEELTNPLPSGSSPRTPSIMEGESREGVIIRPDGGGGNVILFSGSGGRTYFQLRNFTVDAINLRNGETTGIRFQNKTTYLGAVLEDIEIKNMQGPGLVPGSGMLAPVFRRLSIHDSVGNNKQSPHGIYTRSHGGIYEDIEIYKIPCMGVNVRADASGSSGNVFRRVTIYETGYNTTVGFNCANGNDSAFDVQQNNTTIEQSVCYSNADNCIRIRRNASGAKLYQNRIYGNGKGILVEGSRAELKGNAIYDNKTENIVDLGAATVQIENTMVKPLGRSDDGAESDRN